VTVSITRFDNPRKFPKGYDVIERDGKLWLLAAGEEWVMGEVPPGPYRITKKYFNEIIIVTEMKRKVRAKRRKQPTAKMKNVLVFDTETTGKPKNYTAPMSVVDNWPRVIQLAWSVYTAGGELISKQKHLIKPDGWAVPVEEFWIKHGYSTEGCAADGIAIKHALEMFLADLQNCVLIVAHNMQFDYNVLGAEMIRAGVRAGKKTERFCTMEAGVNVCKIPGKRGYKWPTLSELHKHLYNGEDFTGAHDAGADVTACARCFFRMLEIENGII
jgi:DNA polymerase III epsilon subunit-like protein